VTDLMPNEERAAAVREVEAEIAGVELKLLSPSTLAAELDVSEHTLANWRAAGTGPAYARVGGLVRFGLRRQSG